MSPYTAQIRRIIAGEALRPCAVHAGQALDLLDRAAELTANRTLDIIALECLFVAALDGAKNIDVAFTHMLRQAVIARTTVIKSAHPLADLTHKIERLKRAHAMNGCADTENQLRALVNQVRKAFPGFGIRLAVDQHQIRIISDLVLRSNGMKQAFGSAPIGKLGALLVQAEQHLADWAWLQTERLQRMEVLIVRANRAYTPVKRRISSKRRKLTTQFARLSRMEAKAA